MVMIRAVPLVTDRVPLKINGHEHQVNKPVRAHQHARAVGNQHN
jgi:hypothetical protein